MTSYRYPHEQSTLIITMGVILIVSAFAAGFTICLLPLAVAAFMAFAYQMNRSHHMELLKRGKQITPQTSPPLTALVEECQRKLRIGAVEVFAVPSRELNAYTFGFNDPRVVVLHSALFRYLDADEIRFILGHEMGHIALNHTWLNTLLGGMSGVPLPFGAAAILILAFRKWNRMCEYSSDRAGLLVCGSLDKAISALVKLVNKEADTPAELEEMLVLLDREDDSMANVVAESLASHPMIGKRIEQLRAYAATMDYQKLQAEINRQVA